MKKELTMDEIIGIAIRHFKKTNGAWPKPKDVKEMLHSAGIITMSYGDEPWQSHFKNKIEEEKYKIA